MTYPDLSEGQLAKLRAAVVNSRALADVARRLRARGSVHLGRGEESTGGRDKSSILADTMEAVIGAVFLEHGVEGARVFVHDLFDDLMADAATRGAGLDWKTSLQEIASLGGHGVPVYEVTESGPDHAKTFVATVGLGEQTYGPGTGRNKKEAEQKAAALAFAAIARRRSRCRCPTSSTPDLLGHRSRSTATTVPELPEVESVRRGLADGLTGRTISRVAVLHPRPVRRHLPGPDDFAAQLVGRTFAEPRRRGKYLWLPFADGDALLAHLGMSGQFRFAAADAPFAPNTRVLVDFTDPGLQLRFVDQRDVRRTLAVRGRRRAAAGDRPHRPRPVRSRVRPRRRRPLGSGGSAPGSSGPCSTSSWSAGWATSTPTRRCGAARLHYARATDTLPRPAAVQLLTAAAEVMAEALQAGGTSFDSLYVNVNGASGYFDRSLAAYGRKGEPCPRCGTAIRREAFMNRSSYRCPRCQRTQSAAHPASEARITPRGPRRRPEGWADPIVKRLHHYVTVRDRHNWRLLLEFGLVGGFGVLVDMAVLTCDKVGPDADSVAWRLPLTGFNVRWFHVYLTIAFMVANLWNFQINRWWTFERPALRLLAEVPAVPRASGRSPWSPTWYRRPVAEFGSPWRCRRGSSTTDGFRTRLLLGPADRRGGG